MTREANDRLFNEKISKIIEVSLRLDAQPFIMKYKMGTWHTIINPDILKYMSITNQ